MQLLAEDDGFTDVLPCVGLDRHQLADVTLFENTPVLVKLLKHSLDFEPVLLEVFH